MALKALIFDIDGTLAETEELHRQAFNRTFARFDLDWEWDRDLYSSLLATTGGKERMLRYIEDHDPTRGDLRDKVADMHKAKTQAYLDLMAEGELRLRPGVERLIGEARARRVKLAIATTTTPANVEALLRATLGEASLDWFAIAAGDMVARKKPDPAIFLEALRMLDVAAADTVAFEDSANGVRSALGAGLAVVATPSFYLAHEDLSAATTVVSDLGEPGAAHMLVSGKAFAKGYVDIDGLAALL